MVIAFVTVQTEGGGKEKEVLEEIRKTKGVQEAFIVYGAYDIIAKVVAESEAELKIIVSKDIRKIKAVNSTGTMIVVES